MKARGRPPIDRGPQDEEGSPDIYTQIFQLMHKTGTIDRDLEEVMSMDWRAERDLVSTMIKNVPLQASFIPRLGEIVLWCRKVEGEIVLDPETDELKMHDSTSGRYLGHPQWLAGVITQVPAEEVLVTDLLQETSKRHAVNLSGFRVECLPDPNGSAKGLSKQYSYVPMHHIRPMCFWNEAMKGIPDKQWHPSIPHALSVTANLSTIERYRAEGTWPNCNIHSKGIFIGAEALFIGDAARIIRQSGTRVSDVLRIRDILVSFEGLTVANDGNVSSSTAHSIHVYLLGEGYTLDQQSSYKGMEVDLDKVAGSLPPGMRGYDKWYHMCEPGKRLKITYDCVLGRCFEADAMRSWFALPKENLDLGLSGTLIAREYSARSDMRIAGSGKKWYWGNYRADSLDIETFNGFEVGQYNTDRDPKMWRSNLKVLDGVADKAAQNASVRPDKVAPTQVDLTSANGKSSLVARALQHDESSEGTSERTSFQMLLEQDADSVEDEIGAVVDSVISGQLLGEEGDIIHISGDTRSDEDSDGEITGPKRKRVRHEV